MDIKAMVKAMREKSPSSRTASTPVRAEKVTPSTAILRGSEDGELQSAVFELVRVFHQKVHPKEVLSPKSFFFAVSVAGLLS